MHSLPKEQIYQLVDDFKASPENKPIILFGAGQIGSEAVKYCLDNGIHITCIADNNAELWGQSISGIEIVSPDTIELHKPFLIIMSANFYNEMALQLSGYGLNNYISYFMFKGRYNFVQGEYPEASSVQRALNWMIQNQQENGGVSVFGGSVYEYPEVTGYIIPTMLSYGLKEEALAMAHYLDSVINDNGSFNAAGSDRAYLFDTAQALRGLNAIQKITNKYYDIQIKAAEHLFSALKDNDGIFPKSYEDDPIVPEPILLFGLPPMLEYAQLINDHEKIQLVHASVKRYLADPNVLLHKTLTHFLAYQIDSLIDLGYENEVKDIIEKLLVSQRNDGSIPAYDSVDWVCITGCSQIAICLYKLGRREPADKLMAWVENNMESDGGFLGSVGNGADYFADREIAWATKFYLDAYKLMIKAHFNDEFAPIAPSEIDEDDAEVTQVISEIINGNSVLEVGCGKGRILKRIHEKLPDCRLYGIDISPVMLSAVPEYVKTTVGEIEFLPYGDNSFDVVYAVECIEHSPNLKAAVNELVRVCKPGGKVIIIDKQMSGWGRFSTPPWERWPDRAVLESLLQEKCNDVNSYALKNKGHDERDDLFIKWMGVKHIAISEKAKKVVFFGAGATGRLGLYYAERSGMKIDLIVDNNSKLWGNCLCGVEISSPNVLLDKDKYTVIITVGYEFLGAVKEQLSSMGLTEDADFFEFHKVFLQGYSGFGAASGVLNMNSEFELIKTGANNKLVVNLNDRCVYRLINDNIAGQFIEIYNKCKDYGIFDKFVTKTEISDVKIAQGYSCSFKHEYIPLFTYAVEWSPRMFYDYTLFMIDFLAEIDNIGLGWLDGHAFNATFHNGKFVFFDFDAIRTGTTPHFYIQEFINAHLVILLMMSENLMDKAYLYLNNPGQKLSINDIAGYLSADTLSEYKDMFKECYESALEGNIQKCCEILKDYVMNVQFKQILQSGWNGYQNELYEKSNDAKWSDKQRTVVEMVRSVKPRTMLDLAGNMGWYGFTLHDEMERCITADLDYNCVDFVYQMVTDQNVPNVYPVYLNLIAPTPAYYRDLHIGDTAIVPWRKSAIERFKSEMVLALAVMHHLAFAQQLSYAEIIGQFELYTSRWLIIEFIEREDSVVAPALKNGDFEWYTKENFETELLKSFSILAVKNSEPTRVLYLCEKK
ncbi:methyltransferase domain-containing protein [Paenibacillus amylolyticus]|uniref:methyltransferase domain-containing protein n=1 Tax=Paenibacillus amylolyticus TaxID=1451 RepID=UPI00339B7022